MPGSKKGRRVNAAKGARMRNLPRKRQAAIRRRHTARMLELLVAGRSQREIAADLGMSLGYVNGLHAEAVEAALGKDREAMRRHALGHAHAHGELFERMRQMAMDRSLRVRTVVEEGETTRVIEVEDFEAVRKMGDGMAKQSERFGKICGTDAPTKMEVTPPPGLTPGEYAALLEEPQTGAGPGRQGDKVKGVTG